MKLLHELLDFVRQDTPSVIIMIRWIVVGIGFIANLPREKIVKVGNASLEGATIMLLSCTMRRRIEELVQAIEDEGLETTPDFFDIFVEGCMFKPMVLEQD